MDREDLARLCDARDTLCAYCGDDNCEDCKVTALIDQAFNEDDEED